MAGDYPLAALGLKIREHWKTYRPAMYAELLKAGTLEESVYAAQERTNDLMDELLAKGLPYHEAWELARQKWAFLPSEDESAG